MLLLLLLLLLFLLLLFLLLLLSLLLQSSLLFLLLLLILFSIFTPVSVNECTENTDNCHVDATCADTPGAFTCMCNMGYNGDGVTCTNSELMTFS